MGLFGRITTRVKKALSGFGKSPTPSGTISPSTSFAPSTISKAGLTAATQQTGQTKTTLSTIAPPPTRTGGGGSPSPTPSSTPGGTGLVVERIDPQTREVEERQFFEDDKLVFTERDAGQREGRVTKFTIRRTPGGEVLGLDETRESIIPSTGIQPISRDISTKDDSFNPLGKFIDTEIKLSEEISQQRAFEKQASFGELFERGNLPGVVRKGFGKVGSGLTGLSARILGQEPSVRAGEIAGEALLFSGFLAPLQTTTQITKAVQPSTVIISGTQKSIGKKIQTDVFFLTSKGEKGFARGISIVKTKGDKSKILTQTIGGKFRRGVDILGRDVTDITSKFVGRDLTIAKAGTLNKLPASIQLSVGKTAKFNLLPKPRISSIDPFAGVSVGIQRGREIGTIGRVVSSKGEAIVLGVLKKPSIPFKGTISRGSSLISKSISKSAFQSVTKTIASSTIKTPSPLGVGFVAPLGLTSRTRTSTKRTQPSQKTERIPTSTTQVTQLLSSTKILPKIKVTQVISDRSRSSSASRQISSQVSAQDIKQVPVLKIDTVLDTVQKQKLSQKLVQEQVQTQANRFFTIPRIITPPSTKKIITPFVLPLFGQLGGSRPVVGTRKFVETPTFARALKFDVGGFGTKLPRIELGSLLLDVQPLKKGFKI